MTRNFWRQHRYDKRLQEERAEALRKLRERGMGAAEIREITGLTEAEMEGVQAPPTP